jgi:phosphate transport system substrate-binding protein
MRGWRGALIAGLVLGLGPAGCGSPKQETSHLVVAGSATLAPLLQQIAERFEHDHPTVHIHVESGTSAEAVAATRSGLADVGMMTRLLQPGEAGVDLFPLARDGMAFIVHKSNPVARLNQRQVAGLFSGLFLNWKEVGGTDRAVVPISHVEGRALRHLFLERFGLLARQVVPGPAVGSSEQAIHSVSEHPGAIAYVSLGEAVLAARGKRQPIRLVALDGVAPTPENVERGAYPITRPLALITRMSPGEPARAFVEFARSPQVHQVIRKKGFSPVTRSGP